MPAEATYTDALNYITSTITQAADDSQLVVTLRRLAVLIANREDGPELLEGFRDAFYREMSDLRYRRQLEVAMRGKN